MGSYLHVPKVISLKLHLTKLVVSNDEMRMRMPVYDLKPTY